MESSNFTEPVFPRARSGRSFARIGELTEISIEFTKLSLTFNNKNNLQKEKSKMKNCLIIFIALILGLTAGPTLAQTNNVREKVKELDAFYTDLHNYGEFNGNILVAERGKIIYRKSFGIANLETRAKLNENSLFYLASVTKQFTATAILLLAKEGKLSLADDITEHIPELSFYKGVTIDHLIRHTSGMPDYMQLLDKKWDKSKVAANVDVINLMSREKPALEFVPNEKWEYSNTGYVLLASIIERASHKPYNEYLEERIFKPMNMKNTAVLKDNLNVKNLALGYEETSKGDYTTDIELKYAESVYGPGRLYSTVNDLLKWDRALKNKRLISGEDQKLMFSNSKLNSGENTNYGLGWFLKDDEKFGKLVYHSGKWVGYITFLERDLESDKTIIILQNNANATGKERLLAEDTRKILHGLPVALPYRLPDEILKSYAGSYINEKGAEVKISFKDRSLWVPAMGTKFELMPVSESKFKVNGFRPEVTYEFIKDKSGTVEKYRVRQSETGVEQTSLRKK
jgi:CubicO group peptidase (beta-lactamase class C family)